MFDDPKPEDTLTTTVGQWQAYGKSRYEEGRDSICREFAVLPFADWEKYKARMAKLEEALDEIRILYPNMHCGLLALKVLEK